MTTCPLSGPRSRTNERETALPQRVHQVGEKGRSIYRLNF